jgi:hypothetical protein
MFTSAPGKYGPQGRYPLDPLIAEQFEVLFGPEPTVRAKTSEKDHRSNWGQARRYFEGLAIPSVPEHQLALALEDFHYFGFQHPVFFQSRGRVLARFPGNDIAVNPDEASIVAYPGPTIAAMQSARIRAGVKVEPVHPFVPDHLKKANSEL